jgi:hypothetical protein
MRLLLSLALAFSSVAVAAGPPPATSPTPGAAAPVASAPRETFDTLVTAQSPAGLHVSANLRDEYLAGLPILVELRVGNTGAAALTTPDLNARPHLVHFLLTSPNGKKSERYTTPPAFDTGGDWTIAPRAERAVLLEIPSSAALEPGNWQLEVLVGDGERAVVLPAQKFVVSPVRPTAGDLLWEPTIARKSGALIPWVHRAEKGWDVYLNLYAADNPDKLLVHTRLFRSREPLSPMLSLTQANTARSRWLYWEGAAGELRTVRIEGNRASGTVRSLGLPWPTAVPLARGVSDTDGGLTVPLWVPARQGTAGSVRLLTMTERGQVEYRVVAEFAARPPLARTGVDAAGRAVLVLAHDKGLDVYRADSTRDVRLPVVGARAWKAGDGWTTAAVAIDALPAADGRPGGLGVVAVQLLPATESTPAQYRSLYADLAGKLQFTGPAATWSGPLQLRDVIPAGYGPFHYLAVDPQGNSQFGQAGATTTPMGKLPPASIWGVGTGWRLRWVGKDRVVEERAVPAVAP